MDSSDSSPDASLIGQVANGDQAALRALYRLHGRLVYSLAYNMVGNSADAEEITQDVFLRVWDKAAHFRPERGSALAWIVTMARHLTIDRMRSRGASAARREVGIDATTVAETLPDGADSPETAVVRGDESRTVRQALSALDKAQRQVVVLSYYKGLSHGKIANHLDMPVGTVKTRIRAAIGELRRILGS